MQPMNFAHPTAESVQTRWKAGRIGSGCCRQARPTKRWTLRSARYATGVRLDLQPRSAPPPERRPPPDSPEGAPLVAAFPPDMPTATPAAPRPCHRPQPVSGGLVASAPGGRPCVISRRSTPGAAPNARDGRHFTPSATAPPTSGRKDHHDPHRRRLRRDPPPPRRVSQQTREVDHDNASQLSAALTDAESADAESG